MYKRNGFLCFFLIIVQLFFITLPTNAVKAAEPWVRFLDFEDVAYRQNFKKYGTNSDAALLDGDYATGGESIPVDIVTENAYQGYCLRLSERTKNYARVKLAHLLPEPAVASDYVDKTFKISAYVMLDDYINPTKEASVLMSVMSEKSNNVRYGEAEMQVEKGVYKLIELEFILTQAIIDDTGSKPLRVAFETKGGAIPTKVYIDNIRVESFDSSIKAANIFADNMVLQRHKPIPVWGVGSKDGVEVTVAVGDNEKTTTVKNGKWYVELDPMEAQKGLEMVIKSGNAVVANYKNVAIGEVWLCSGQSNMEFKMEQAKDAQAIIESSANYDVRIFDVKNVGSYTPLDTNPSNTWKLSNPENVKSVSAIGYIACYQIQQYLGDVVVGLVQCDWSSSCGEAWLDMETLEKRPEYRDIIGVPNPDGSYPARTEGTSLQLQKQSYNYYKSIGFTTYQYVPTALYNGMLHPIIPYALAGVMWYQGESTINSEFPDIYQYILYDLIHLWREKFKDPQLPFLIFQLAPYNSEPYRDFPAIRQVQLDTHKRIGNTALITTCYEGPKGYPGEEPIHPIEKIPVGNRAAKAAINMVYGGNEEHSGPEYMSMTVEGNKAILSFSHIGSGLRSADGGALTGFEISEDGIHFVPATAVIVGDTVEVTGEGVENPVEVRYCYVRIKQPEGTLGGNLTNDTGIPASPFRASVASIELFPVQKFNVDGIAIENVTAANLADGIKLKCTVENSGYSMSKQRLIVALYNNGALKHIELKDATLNTIGRETYEIFLLYDEDLVNCKIKVMLWDEVNTMKPVSLFEEIDIF